MFIDLLIKHVFLHVPQYLIITYRGKGSEKEYVWGVCVCMKLNYFAVHLKLTQHCKIKHQ